VIIGVTGYARHGKDTTGQFLVDNYGFTRYAFADQLKSMALALNPIVQRFPFPKHPERLRTLVGLLGWDRAKENSEVRRFLQVLGTEAVRDHLGQDSWVLALEKKLREDKVLDSDGEPNPGSRAVITDVRFPNEARFIHDVSGEIWKVKRLEYSDGAIRDFDNGLGTDHPSEKFIDSIKVDRTLIATEIKELLILVEGAMRRRSRP
jgi:hypothetical protein